MKNIVYSWNSNKICSGIFHFKCEDDRMKETHWTFSMINENGDVEEFSPSDNPNFSSLVSDLTELVYKRVHFYEVSDGHYLGETGTVEVTINDGGDISMIKSSMEHWSENLSINKDLDISPELGEFIFKKIDQMESAGKLSGSRWQKLLRNSRQESTLINYKQDCIITDKEGEMLSELVSRIESMVSGGNSVCRDNISELVSGDYVKIEYLGDEDDSWSIFTDMQEWKEGKPKTKLIVTFGHEFHTVKPSIN